MSMLKINDYVRFKDKRGNTYIRKVIDGYKEHWYGCRVDKTANNVPYVSEKNIIKSSPNIIDLIEKSDLVVDNYGNVYVVDYVFDNYIYTTTKQGNIVKTLCDYQIKSIVTKEQFENMKYEVN